MKTVSLRGKRAAGRVALVDDEDYDLVMQYKWYVWECPAKNQGPYAHCSIGGRTLRMHQLITGYARTDHANGNGLDNRRANLRESTRAQNAANRRMHVTNPSGFKGVRRRADNPKSPWTARICVDRKERHLGYFATAEEAARAYDAAALKLHGEFARLTPNTQETNSRRLRPRGVPSRSFGVQPVGRRGHPASLRAQALRPQDSLRPASSRGSACASLFPGDPLAAVSRRPPGWPATGGGGFQG